MKKSFIPVLLFSLVNEVCDGSDGGSAPKNTGGKKQCLEGAVRTYILATEDQSFASVTAAKALASWDASKAAKDVAVFWDIEEIANNNTAATILEKRYSSRKTKASIKGVDYTHNISVCSHEVLESYEDSNFTRVYRITDENEILCEVQDDGTVKGEPLSSMIVSEREDATTDADPISVVTFKFKSYSMSILKADFDMDTYEGIFDVAVEQITARSSTLELKVRTECTNTLVTSLADGDIVVRNASGVVQNISFVVANSSGVYTITGTGFESGFTVELNGVVTSASNMYETPEVLTLTVE